MIELLIAWLNVDREEAVRLFVRLLDGAEALKGCDIVEHFLNYACRSHSVEMRKVVEAMASCSILSARKMAARQSIRTALQKEDWRSMADRLLRSRSAEVREAAAQSAVDCWQHEAIRAGAGDFLIRCFRDKDSQVRGAASWVFRHMPAGGWSRQRAFAVSFATSPALVEGASHFVHSLESALPVPVGLVLEVVPHIIRQWKRDPDIPGGMNRVRWGSKNAVTLVLSALTNAPDGEARSRCLDLLDEMLESGFCDVQSMNGRLE